MAAGDLAKAAGDALKSPRPHLREANTPPLGFMEDDPIWGAQLRVKGLGDGLSKLAEVAPVELHRKEQVVIVVECQVDHVAFPTAKGPDDEDGVNRLAVLKAGNVTIVDRSVVAKALKEHQKLLDEAANRRSLFEEQKAKDEGD